MNTATSKGHCKGTNARGEPCAAFAVSGSEYCFWHDPDLADARAAAGAKGGRARHGRTVGTVAGDLGPVRLGDVEAVRSLLERAAADALQLENSLGRGRLLVAIGSAALRVVEVGDLADRLDQLEESIVKLKQQQGGRRGRY